MTIRVILADDQSLIRAGLAALVDSAEDMQVVGEALDGADAVRQVRARRPDVVVMDIRMPGVDGIAACEQITSAPDLADVKVLILTTFEQDDLVVAAMRAGASGFLGKGAGPRELLDAVRVVAAGEALLSPRATRVVIEQLICLPLPTDHAGAGRDAAPHPGLGQLTDREREIVMLVAHGLSNEEIAERLVVSPLTVKTHVNRAMTKVGARDRAQLVVVAYRSGLVQPGE